MVNSFGVMCACVSQRVLSESPEEQVNRLFNKAEEKEKETVIQILGSKYWTGGHVHDGDVYQALLDFIVQILRYPVLEFGIVRRMVW